MTDRDDLLVVPYVCPECGHDRWLSIDPMDPDSWATKCTECGHEDEVRV